MSDDRTVEVSALVVRATAKALLLERDLGGGGVEKSWVPRSCVVGGDDYDEGDDDIMEVARWLAVKNDWPEAC